MKQKLGSMIVVAVVAGMAVFASLSGFAWTNDAERAVVGLNEILTVDVPTDTVWDKPVFVQGVFRKTGAGKLTLSAEKRPLKRIPDFVMNDTPRPSKGRVGFCTWNYFGMNSELQTSGLVGPVTIEVYK